MSRFDTTFLADHVAFGLLQACSLTMAASVTALLLFGGFACAA